MRRRYTAADTSVRCRAVVRIGKGKDDVADCMRRAVCNGLCRQHAAIRDRESRRTPPATT